MINGDRKLSWVQKLLYFPQCIKGWNANVAKDLLTTRFVNLKPIDQETGSPSRRLSNMYWNTLNWDSLAAQLGGKVKVFDVACGAGQYGLRYRDYLGESFDGYTGLDIYKHADFPPAFTHINDKAENIRDYIDDHNLIVSQSALEHIEDDVGVLVSSVIAQKALGKPFLQIHLLPASSCLFLYLWHGWRQYSIKNLSAISERLTDLGGVNTQIVPLGGWNVFFSHFFNITIPSLLCRLLRKQQVYSWDIKGSAAAFYIANAVMKDRFSISKVPSFWAFIIYSQEIDVELALYNHQLP
jgi:hypothetical protein